MTRSWTGDADLDRKISELVREAGVEREVELIEGIVAAALQLARDQASRENLRIASSAIREMRYAFKVFAEYRHARKVTVFGSARTKPGDPDYEQGRLFGEAVAREGWMVITGAGPGTMQAANEGAGRGASFGVNIRLPFESAPNPFVAGDPKLVNFKYFFTRKLMFMKEADAFVLLPGGFGTMDEAFELLILVQTGKSDMHPIVLLDPPGGAFWTRWMDMVREDLLAPGYISPDDAELFAITDSVDVAVKQILRFYANYHSMRYVGTRLVIRLRRAPDEALLARLSDEFADVIVRGGIGRVKPSSGEVRDKDALDLERVALVFDRIHHGRLRILIDRLNEVA